MYLLVRLESLTYMPLTSGLWPPTSLLRRPILRDSTIQGHTDITTEP